MSNNHASRWQVSRACYIAKLHSLRLECKQTNNCVAYSSARPLGYDILEELYVMISSSL